MFRRPGYWVGDPCVVVNMNVSWMRFAALYILERFPELHDLMQENGADPSEVDVLRANHLPNAIHWLDRIYFGDQRENLAHFAFDRLVRRYRHLPAFRDRWPEIRLIYEKARMSGAAGAGATDLGIIDGIYSNAGLAVKG
jgi:hypothetical protein